MSRCAPRTWRGRSPEAPRLRRMGLQVLKRSGGDLSKTLIAEFRDKSEGKQKNLIQSVCELDQEVVTAVLEWLRSTTSPGAACWGTSSAMRLDVKGA